MTDKPKSEKIHGQTLRARKMAVVRQVRWRKKWRRTYNRYMRAYRAYVKKHGKKRKPVSEEERERRRINRIIRTKLTSNLYRALHNVAKNPMFAWSLVGCSADELRAHLAAKFEPWMSFANHGKWHVDHIRPCSTFDLLDPEQQKICFHFTNLQPLPARKNLRKAAKWSPPVEIIPP